MADISSLFGLGSALGAIGGIAAANPPASHLIADARAMADAQAGMLQKFQDAQLNRLVDQDALRNALIAGSGFTHTKPTLPDPTETREIAGPILALRGWRNGHDISHGNGLYPVGWSSQSNPRRWNPKQSSKATEFGYHQDGGYWGLRFKEDIPSEADFGGIVAMWGEIVVHERGFRAEYAYPVAIWPNKRREFDSPMPGFPVGGADYSDIETVAEEYGIEWLKCAPWEELEEVA